MQAAIRSNSRDEANAELAEAIMYLLGSRCGVTQTLVRGRSFGAGRAQTQAHCADGERVQNAANTSAPGVSSDDHG